MASIQGYLEENRNLFSTSSLENEQQWIDIISYTIAGNEVRQQTFNFAIQELIVNCLYLTNIQTYNALVQQCNTNCKEYNKAINFILNNGNGQLRITAESVVLSIYDNFKNSANNNELVKQIT